MARLRAAIASLAVERGRPGIIVALFFRLVAVDGMVVGVIVP